MQRRSERGPARSFAAALRGRGAAATPATVANSWALDEEALFAATSSSRAGLGAAEAARRLAAWGTNDLERPPPLSRLGGIWTQLRSPLVALLLVAALVALAIGDWVDAAIVLVIVLASVVLGSSREYRAQAALERLRARIATTTSVLRDGRRVEVPVSKVVVGDVLLLGAGSVVPADARLIEATHLFVNEAALTGESFPVEKRAGRRPREAPLGERGNCVFAGTDVRTGTAKAVVVATGRATHFGAIAHRLILRPPETDFEHGLRRFGYVLLITMLVAILVVFSANVLLARPPVETLLFSLALAVGLSPELLPAILSVNLAQGARSLADGGVLVRRLSAIENLGSMDILCTDKTGTLTEGVVSVDGAWDHLGRRCERALELATTNAALQSGLSNPLDEALLRQRRGPPPPADKLAEIPFDFVRKRLGVVVREGGRALLIVKGAFGPLLELCSRTADGRDLDDGARAALRRRYEAWGREGVRVLGIATRALELRESYGREDEHGLSFEGFLTFVDQPKEGVGEAIAGLGELGVAIKLITGDARLTAEHVARAVGLRGDRVLSGREIAEMGSEALWRAAELTDLFVEVDPHQKERIIRALKRTGHVVGFLGDGINDAPAMHVADTSASVQGAAEVATQAADFVLLERHLDVLRKGIEEGRRTFANTLKYVLTTMSANLGNMVSMAVASLFLPFLPMLAGQILLNNFLSDVPAVGLATDSVDREWVDRPRRWDMRALTRFMLSFGLVSSLFDFLTFGVLLTIFAAGPELFRTGWFMESLLTELVIALVVRTRRPFYRSRPGTFLLVSTAAVAALTVAIPSLPGVATLGFVPVPGSLVLTVLAITAGYVLVTEQAKKVFYAAPGPLRSRGVQAPV